MQGRKVLKFIVFGIITILVVSALVTMISNILNPPNRTITFSVEIPSHTPTLDTIVLHVFEDRYPMEKVNDRTHEVTVKLSIEFQDLQVISYGYSRGGFHVTTEDGFFLSADDGIIYPRTFTLGEVEVINDMVNKWRWYPESAGDDPSEIDIPSSVNSTTITSRDEFRKGVIFPDFWRDFWEYQYDATIDHLQTKGYDWIQLSPPWDMIQADPPIFGNPDYPDEKLRNHIRVFKDAGFKVALYPQICCTVYDTSERDSSWWLSGLDEYKEFVRYHADLAREEGVDTFVLAGNPSLAWPGNNDLPDDVNITDAWLEIWEIAKTSNAPVSFSLHAWGADFPDKDVLPWPRLPDYFINSLDFLSVGLSSVITTDISPTQQQIDEGLNVIFGRFDYAHNWTDFPIVLSGVWYESHNESTITLPEEFYMYDDPRLAPYTYNASLQAMVYEGIMKQIAHREFIHGILPWGYSYVSTPDGLDGSIRGKMAENLLSQWFSKFKISQSQSQLGLTSVNFQHTASQSLIDRTPFHFTIISTFTTFTRKDFWMSRFV